jgi:hypothetical protein
MKGIKLATLALVAILAIGALAAASAMASHPEFKGSHAELSFKGTSGFSLLRGKRVGVEAIISCKEDGSSGVILDASPLAHKVLIEFKNDCLQKLGSGSAEQCKEPILTKVSEGELGLLLVSGHKLVGLYLQPEKGVTEFATVECGATTTKVKGSIIGEFPEETRGGTKQYNKSVSSFELEFKASGITQQYESIDLLGLEMSGDKLSVEGFLGEGASEETTETLTPDGSGEITT